MNHIYMVAEGETHAIDFLGPNNKGAYCNKTRDELEAERGVKIELVDSDTLLARARDHARLPIKEITRQSWWDAFECLPPLCYAGTGGAESFFCIEPYTADIHYGYVRVGERYFEFRDRVSMRPHQRVQLARDYIAANPVTTLVAETA